MPDYLVHYTTENTFRFTELINDDYFKAIRTLFNAELYVSSAKLLISCVDTLSFVEYQVTSRETLQNGWTPSLISPRMASPRASYGSSATRFCT